ncbi:MAG: SDR family NAD(P)-dependent oxidoreductase [Bacteroidetes bacterium]|nr:SDR family NAD(P)-dependent oxidoreductase [Bacteroidota bacterium]
MGRFLLFIGIFTIQFPDLMNPPPIAIITGAYGAIGKAISLQMVQKGYTTVLSGKDESKLKSTVDEIRKITGNPNVRFEAVDLSLKSGIKAMADRWDGPLHLLINNACTAPRQRTETSEGIEMEFATNVLGYFWMIVYFRKFLQYQEDARIINVASYWAGELDLNDLEFKIRRYDNDTAYRQSKQADRMLTAAFAEKLKKYGIAINSCHPGDVNSKLSNSLGFGGHETPAEGAVTPVWLATDPALKGITGKYFANKSESFCQFSQDTKAIEELYATCEGY